MRYYKTLHIALRVLVILTGSFLVLASISHSFYELLVRLGVDAYLGVWIIVSPAIVVAILGLEWAVMRKDPRESRALATDLVLGVAWCAVCIVLVIHGLTHFPVL